MLRSDYVHLCSGAIPTAIVSTLSDSGCPSATHFRCLNQTVCIPKKWTCDSLDDCGDKSDEGYLAGCPGLYGRERGVNNGNQH